MQWEGPRSHASHVLCGKEPLLAFPIPLQTNYFIKSNGNVTAITTGRSLSIDLLTAPGRAQTCSDPGARWRGRGGQGQCFSFHSQGPASAALEGFDQRDLCSLRLNCPSLTSTGQDLAQLHKAGPPRTESSSVRSTAGSPRLTDPVASPPPPPEGVVCNEMLLLFWVHSAWHSPALG